MLRLTVKPPSRLYDPDIAKTSCSGGNVRKHIVIAVVIVSAGLSLGRAAQAAADGPVFNGTFRLETQDGSANTWVVTPCGPACAHVVSDTGLNADARRVDGQWTFTYTHPTGWDCEDGTDAPATRRVTIDAATLRGTVAQGPDDVCGETDVVDEPFTFTLNRVA